MGQGSHWPAPPERRSRAAPRDVQSSRARRGTRAPARLPHARQQLELSACAHDARSGRAGVPARAGRHQGRLRAARGGHPRHARCASYPNLLNPLTAAAGLGLCGRSGCGRRAGCCAQPGAARAAGAAWRGRPLCLCLVRCLRQRAPADQRLPRAAMREALTPGWRCLCAPWAARPDTQSLHRCLARREPRRLQRATEVPPARVPAPRRPCSAAGWLFPVCMDGCLPAARALLHPLIDTHMADPLAKRLGCTGSTTLILPLTLILADKRAARRQGRPHRLLQGLRGGRAAQRDRPHRRDASLLWALCRAVGRRPAPGAGARPPRGCRRPVQLGADRRLAARLLRRKCMSLSSPDRRWPALPRPEPAPARRARARAPAARRAPTSARSRCWWATTRRRTPACAGPPTSPAWSAAPRSPTLTQGWRARWRSSGAGAPGRTPAPGPGRCRLAQCACRAPQGSVVASRARAAARALDAERSWAVCCC